MRRCSRGDAALALGWVGTPQMVPTLRSHLGAEQARRVRENLAAATYRLGERGDLAVLLDLPSDGRKLNSRKIRKSLRHVARPRDDLVPIYADEAVAP